MPLVQDPSGRDRIAQGVPDNKAQEQIGTKYPPLLAWAMTVCLRSYFRRT